jgi:hypothetical protein
MIALRYAEPILDGDLFFHMAYAKQMLMHHTLRLDHTEFSWTPTSNRMIYCAWLSELFLYELWEHAGMAGLFAFRYLCVLTVTLLAWGYARRAGRADEPLTWLVLLNLVIGSHAGTILKPEIFSLLCFHLLLYSFFRWKLDGSNRWLYLLPAIMLVWVNAHGGFILATPLLMAIFVGESLNRRMSRPLALSMVACAVTPLLNPYGWRYPWQLFEDMVLQKTARPDGAWNDAMRSVFSLGAAGVRYYEFMALMLLILVLLSIRARRVDWSITLMNLGYLGLFLAFLRSTGFWPGAFAYGAIYLMAQEPRTWFAIRFSRLALNLSTLRAATLALFAVLAVQSTEDVLHAPEWGSWTGFGISYVNPVPEAEFLAAAPLNGRIYNLFDSGAYLLWRLYPKYQVMTDSRSFPYLSWFSDQYNFSMGEDVDGFLAKYPAKVAVIELLHEKLWRHFLQSPQWRPVYYGPSAVIFVRSDAGWDPPLATAQMDEIRNAGAALRVFNFARAVEDFPTAWAMLDRVENHLAFQGEEQELASAQAYREEQRALRRGDWPRARAEFNLAFRNHNQNPRDQMVATLLLATEKLQLAGQPVEATTFPAALQKLAVAEPAK